jgi:hypothetical protein
MKQLSLWAFAISVMMAAISLANADDRGGARDDNEKDSYAIGLWGDLPYSQEQATVGIPNLIADVNSQRLAFTVHDGDLKAGSNSPCDDALYTTALGYFTSLKAPAVFTPGDNDWTDCDRPSNGGYNTALRIFPDMSVFQSKAPAR